MGLKKEKKRTKRSCSSVKLNGNIFFLEFSYQACKSWSTRQKTFKNIPSISMFPRHIWQFFRLFHSPQFRTSGLVGSFIACQWNWCARMMKRTLNVIFWKDCFAVFGEQRHTAREITKYNYRVSKWNEEGYEDCGMQLWACWHRSCT